MSRLSLRLIFGLILLPVSVMASQWALQLRYQNPFPPLSVSLSSPGTQLQDFFVLSLGLRRLAANLAWIQTLQYYGTHEEGQTEWDEMTGSGHYPEFLNHCLRVTRMDPRFTYAYLYGAGILAWNLGRLEEGQKLLEEGIRYNPREWRLPEYLAALAYERNHDKANLAQFLERAVKDPECPNLLRSILANLYKKDGFYMKSLGLWAYILESGDKEYRVRAEEQIQELSGRLGIPLPPS